MTATIALLTDFGVLDVYVGVMKGVLLGAAPDAHLIDLTHEVPPGDIRAAAFRLWQAAPFMPHGTVFLAVVDPGVGSPRRPLAIAAGDFCCVGPDNGLFTYLIAGRPDVQAVQIMAPGGSLQTASDTFHGRDVFAPAAARLALGSPLSELGPQISDPVRIPWPRLERVGRELRGEALCVDRFGNVITSIGRLSRGGGGLGLVPWIPTCPPVRIPEDGLRVRLDDGTELALARTYSEVPAGSPLAYIGSSGLLEIGVNAGRAADRLGLEPGAEVSLLLSR